MIKNVYKDYSIGADGLNFIVFQTKIGTKTDKKTGEKVEYELQKNIAYCGTLEHAFNHVYKIAQRDIISEKDMALKNAMIEIRIMHKQFERLLKETLPERVG